jgi:hypothetical protein
MGGQGAEAFPSLQRPLFAPRRAAFTASTPVRGEPAPLHGLVTVPPARAHFVGAPAEGVAENRSELCSRRFGARGRQHRQLRWRVAATSPSLPAPRSPLPVPHSPAPRPAGYRGRGTHSPRPASRAETRPAGRPAGAGARRGRGLGWIVESGEWMMGSGERGTGNRGLVSRRSKRLTISACLPSLSFPSPQAPLVAPAALADYDPIPRSPFPPPLAPLVPRDAGQATCAPRHGHTPARRVPYSPL